jgi:chromatin remodeling complex protein RSC6
MGRLLHAVATAVKSSMKMNSMSGTLSSIIVLYTKDATKYSTQGELD